MEPPVFVIRPRAIPELSLSFIWCVCACEIEFQSLPSARVINFHSQSTVLMAPLISYVFAYLPYVVFCCSDRIPEPITTFNRDMTRTSLSVLLCYIELYITAFNRDMQSP